MLHPTTQIYHDTYIQAHLAALGRGVQCTRIIRIENDTNAKTYKWLVAFYDQKTGVPLAGYIPLYCAQGDLAELGIVMPDRIIIDGTYIIDIGWRPEEQRQDKFSVTKNRRQAKRYAKSWNPETSTLDLEPIKNRAQFEELIASRTGQRPVVVEAEELPRMATTHDIEYVTGVPRFKRRAKVA